MRRATVTVCGLALVALVSTASCCRTRRCVVAPPPPAFSPLEQADRLARIEALAERRASAESHVETAAQRRKELERDRQVAENSARDLEEYVSTVRAQDPERLPILETKLAKQREVRARLVPELAEATALHDSHLAELRAIDAEMAPLLVRAADAERRRLDAMRRRGETPTPEMIKLAADLYLRAATLAAK